MNSVGPVQEPSWNHSGRQCKSLNLYLNLNFYSIVTLTVSLSASGRQPARTRAWGPSASTWCRASPLAFSSFWTTKLLPWVANLSQKRYTPYPSPASPFWSLTITASVPKASRTYLRVWPSTPHLRFCPFNTVVSMRKPPKLCLRFLSTPVPLLKTLIWAVTC